MRKGGLLWIINHYICVAICDRSLTVMPAATRDRFNARLPKLLHHIGDTIINADCFSGAFWKILAVWQDALRDGSGKVL
ncbi:hypothetical protein C8029_04050 [Roseobacter sp. TSBP12]|nr:hypothetical protein C8029_04050 [Roseobacter sp. TSBP12]